MINELWGLVHKTQMVHPMENRQILAQLPSPSTHVIIVFIVLPTINPRAEKMLNFIRNKKSTTNFNYSALILIQVKFVCSPIGTSMMMMNINPMISQFLWYIIPYTSMIKYVP
jgi:hypothetical protein